MTLLLLLQNAGSAGTITGSLIATLEDTSVSMIGQVAVRGSAAVTLAGTTLAAEGVIGGGYVLEDTTISATGSVIPFPPGCVTVTDALAYVVTVSDTALYDVAVSDAGGC